MNAVIVDIRKKQAAALDESGRVVRIHNAGYEIGQTIELHEVKPLRTPTMLKRFSTGVAAAVLVAMIGTGTAYAMPYGTVTLDGDSSIEYTINCFDYVLDVQATNEEGEALLAEMDTRQLRHHRIDKAVSATVEQMERGGHLETPEGGMQISADTRSEGHTERLRQELEPVVDRGKDCSGPEVNSSPEPPAPHEEGDAPDAKPFLPEEEAPSGDPTGDGSVEGIDAPPPFGEANMPSDRAPDEPFSGERAEDGQPR